MTNDEIRQMLLSDTGAGYSDLPKAHGQLHHILKAMTKEGYIVSRTTNPTRYKASRNGSLTYEASVGLDGMVTIPKKVREHLGIKNDKIKFIMTDGEVTLTK